MDMAAVYTIYVVHYSERASGIFIMRNARYYGECFISVKLQSVIYVV